ncbi:hypothetical protein HYH03_004876 [Edaphochlamys debaryana]|uniref:3'-5' exonuclease n=1 Tax=Edaphochlamys debaryana TaxID=47281 RepID=A0A836C310_9CHLO|nr:hypothetical protein HYH03_004876 [Edaphochlamys debaryana]|eukprot:KAG2497293.1 hypothetical protein HYH03_004876 [Edaphochlamys debaryana]
MAGRREATGVRRGRLASPAEANTSQLPLGQARAEAVAPRDAATSAGGAAKKRRLPASLAGAGSLPSIRDVRAGRAVPAPGYVAPAAPGTAPASAPAPASTGGCGSAAGPGPGSVAPAYPLMGPGFDMPPSFVPYDPPPSLPLLGYTGTVRYATSGVEVDWLVEQLLDAQPDVIGMDAEWRPGNNRIALVQLCYLKRTGPAPGAAVEPDTREGAHTCTLLLHVFHAGFTQRLRRLLEAEVPRKVGVNISGDARKLKADYGVEMRGHVELDAVANERVLQQVDHVMINTEYRRRWSLSALVAVSLRRELPKPKNIRCGDWQAWPLSPAQQRYAALDAYAGLAVWAALNRLPLREKAAPPPPPPAELPAAEQADPRPAAYGTEAAGPSASLAQAPPRSEGEAWADSKGWGAPAAAGGGWLSGEGGGGASLDAGSGRGPSTDGAGWGLAPGGEDGGKGDGAQGGGRGGEHRGGGASSWDELLQDMGG